MPDQSEQRMAVVGRIARAHGNRGQVIVNPETDFPQDRFQAGAELFIERGGRLEPVVVTAARFTRGRPILALAGTESMNAAEALAGLELLVPVDRLVALPEGTFYWHDLVGCRVETVSGELLGTVSEIEGTLDRSRLVVDDGRGEVLIPLAAEICPTIDPQAKRIVVRPPDGLLDVNR
jgi:16S rRNA processing protein RimM